MAIAAGVLLSLWLPATARLYVARTLVDRAYAQERLLPLRFTDARFGPLLSARRGAPGSDNADLLEAEGLLASGLQAHPNDADLIEVQARAYLVAGNDVGAIAALEPLLATLVASNARGLEVRTDLASAHFERAQSGHEAEYGVALDELGQVLAVRPWDGIALFNRALVEEALGDWTGAIEDWRNYGGVNRSGAWSREARAHLAAAERRLQAHDGAVAAPLLAPDAFARQKAISGETDARIEEYLTVATTTWLPAAFAPSGGGDAGARAGLERLGAWVASVHHDRWLQQLLAQSSDRVPFSQATALLAHAVAANAAGQPDAALTAARQAAARFDQAGSAAGRARAAYAMVYALKRQEHSAACLQALQQWLGPAQVAGDGWLEGEAALERLDCAGMASGTAPHALEDAERLATQDGYTSLGLRAAAFRAGATADRGRDAAWRTQRVLLGRYWAARIGAYRGYETEMLLAILAASDNEWHAAERLAAGAVERVARSGERSYEAMARDTWADYADESGDTDLALAQRSAASQLFAQLPQTPTTANLRAYNEISIAETAMRLGQPARAAATLARYRVEQPLGTSLLGRVEPYFALSGQLALARGDLAQAERDERAAIAINESDLRSVSGDEDRLGWQARNQDAYRSWIAIEWALHQDPELTLEYWEWAKGAAVRPSRALAPAFAEAVSRFDGARAPALAEPHAVRAALGGMRRDQVVSYALLPGALAIWVFDDRGIHGVRVHTDAAALEAEARAFARACADRSGRPEAVAAKGRELYRKLLAPVAGWLDANRTLVVEPDGALAEIPFAALTTPAGAWLAQAVEVSPGVAFPSRPNPTGAPVLPLLAVANPAVGNDAQGVPYAPLPEAEREAAAAAQRFGPRSEVLSGDAATAAAALAALPRAQVFHFGGHADSEHLWMAAGGSLVPGDFTAARVRHCQLAVLAACSTASAGALYDPQGFVRALLRAGVPTVVASRWAVDSAATEELCREFYAALRPGVPAASALAEAERQLRRRSATAAPYYWAGFTVYAGGHQP